MAVLNLEFKNRGEAGAIPINASNMNTIVSGVNGMIVDEKTTGTDNTYSCDYLNQKVLYESSTGVGSGSITTTDNPLNYSRIDILTADGSNWNFTNTFYPKIKNKGIVINAIELGTSWTLVCTIRADFSSTGLTILSNLEGKLNQNSSTSSTTLKIVGIIGYK